MRQYKTIGYHNYGQFYTIGVCTDYVRPRPMPILNHDPHGSLTVRTAVADALLANVSRRLGDAEVRAVLECGFDATLSACRNRRPLLDWREFPTRRAL